MVSEVNGVHTIGDDDLNTVWTWNAVVPKTANRCIHEIFAERALEQPSAPAVCAWDGELTYGQLDELSTNFARHLIGLGLLPGALVTLCFEKSMWMPVAVLGVMKVGGASVALDVAQPEERLKIIAGQAVRTVIVSSVSNEELAGRLMNNEAIVAIPEVLARKPPTDIHPELPKVRPSDKLYVVYTSGSTGTPKGATITHTNFASAVLHQQSALGYKQTSRVYDFVSYAFDVAWSNVLHTLTAGACLCIPSQEQRQGDIAASIRELRANYADLTPSISRLLHPSQVPELEHISFSGEVVLPDDVERWRSLKIVLNTYGPAECTVKSTVRQLGLGNSTDVGIGRAVGCNLWVVDTQNPESLVPIGTAGELWLEGPIVGAGYLNEPEKTAASFVIDPTWLLRGSPHTPGRSGVLYKTGDVVKANRDGSLEFVGRKDAQVKIRGQRVELDEVDHYLRRNISSGTDSQIVAEVITPQGGNPMLVAFLTADSKGTMGVTELTADLENRLVEQLPVYMVPAAYIPVPEIPMTATGKTDRRKLREMGSAMTLEELAALNPTREEKVAPTTEMEMRLQGLWASVLGFSAEAIGANDSFLRIGGDSIAMMRLVAAAREQGLVLKVSDVFRHPRLADLAKVVREADSTSPQSSVKPFSLLQTTISEQDAAQMAADLCGVDATRVEDVFPCTPLQEGLLALTAKSSGSGDYISRNMMPLRDDVDLDRFMKAWETLIVNTPILRTRIIDFSGEQRLVQVVLKEETKWNHYDSPETLLAADKQFPMGLGTPLVRLGLVDGSETGGKRWFLWSIHHALYDGWSISLLLDQAERAYRQAGLQDLTSFSKFVQYTSNLDDDAAVQYWEAQFKNCEASPFPVLPSVNHQPIADQTIIHEVPGLRWPRTDTTASMVIRAAWALLAARYSNAQDVVFGSTVTGRQAALGGVEQVAGPTIATVPVRVHLDKDESIGSFLRRVQDQGMEMAEFEQTGLQRIQRISPEIAEVSAFQTLLVVQPPSDSSNQDKSAMFQGDQSQVGSDGGLGVLSTYALTLECELQTSGVCVKISYDSAITQQGAQPKRLADQLEHVIRQLCDPQLATTKLADLDVLSSSDVRDVREWNASQSVTAIDRCVHDLFDETAQVSPDALAVSAWDGELTYAELDRLSNRLASHLQALGVQPEKMVPLCFEKSMWVPVAMLAVLKAGGAFVPLEPALPASRKADILQQTGAGVILTSAENSSLFGDASAQVVVVTKDLFESQLAQSTERLVSSCLPQNIAYVLFTSGSTGRPKGVILEHQAVASSCRAHGAIMGLGAETRALQFSSYSFDASIVEILTTLLHGGCVCIPSAADRMTSLASVMNSMKVNWALLTPTVARLLDPTQLVSLRSLVLGAEALQEQDLVRWKDSVHLFNAYGPTETAVICAMHDHGLKSASPSTIGQAVGSTSWIADPQDHNKLAMLGSVGELLVQGPILARGYLDDEDKTRLAFVTNPDWFSKLNASSGATMRFYKTGDLVRYLEDGSLEFIGRKDAQVKIRGQRVELAEVEHHVKEAVAAVFELSSSGTTPSVVAEVITPDGSTSPMLVVFVDKASSTTAERQTEIISSDIASRLEEILADKLPQYMIPSAFIHITSIPMSISGKTDRRELQKLGGAISIQQLSSSSTADKRAPTTELEKKLQGLWSEVLGLEKEAIGLDDSFLRIGGDSVAAMRLASAASKKGLTVSVVNVFKHPKLHQLAQVVTETNTQEAEEEIKPFSLIKADTDDTHLVGNKIRVQAAEVCGVSISCIEDVFPCSPLQEGLIALTEKRAGDYINRIPLELRRDVDLEQFSAAWEHVVRETSILRTRIVDMPGQGLVQIILNVAARQVETVDADADSLLAVDKREPMGLGTALARLRVARGPSSNHVLLTMHHALYDQWALSLLIERLEKAYQGQALQHPPPFQGFIKHTLNVDNNVTTQYWIGQLDGAEASAVFPTLPSADYQAQTDKRHGQQVTGLTWPKGDVTASTLVRAAWSILLARYTDVTDIVFGATVMGRQVPGVPGIEQMVGPTIATVPVRVKFDWEESIGELISRMQDQSVETAEFAQLGLHRIKRISRDAEHATRFQTLVVIQPVAGEEKSASNVFTSRSLVGADDDDIGAFGTYAFTPVCQLDAGGVHLQINYDSALLESTQIQRMVAQFECVLRQLCDLEHAETKLGAIVTTSEQDLRDIWGWNAVVPERTDHRVHDLLHETSERRLEAQAVCAWDGELTYRQLDHLSTQLAEKLQATHEVQPEVIVPLFFDKSMWMPVAMMGVMKAGGASVAVDISQPDSRLKTIVEQVQGSLILASGASKAAAQRLFPTSTVVNVADLCSLSQPSPAPVTSTVTPSNTLYIVFTSGSTGVPKGVVITHANFSSALMTQTRELGFNEESRVLDFASYAFDAAWYNALHTLYGGGCLCIPSEDDRKGDLSGAIVRLKPTFANLTPKVADLLDPTALRMLEIVELSGESADAGQISRIQEHSQSRFAYGPAECSILSTVSDINATRTTIGKGLGICTWIVDTVSPTNLAGVGCVGELYIEGPLVGQGYLNEPGKTAAAFVESPPWLLKGGRQGRLYKTGDLVRYHDDGSLTFIGRKDTQVKIRGQRVELAEVEHHVAQLLTVEHLDHKEVKSEDEARVADGLQVVAEVLKLKDSNKATLVAFITPPGSSRMTDEERIATITKMTKGIDDLLAKVVPAYMIPSGYIPLAAVPMTATGKTDRRAIRVIGESSKLVTVEQDENLVEPRNETESTMRDVWATVLNVDPASISVEGRFLRLGGDSITAMQVVSRLRQRDIFITVSDLLGLQTIRSIVDLRCNRGDDGLVNAAQPSSALELADEPGKSWPLSPIQQMLFDAHPEGLNHFNQSFLLKLQRDVSSNVIRNAVEVLVERHSMLRARFRKGPTERWEQYIEANSPRIFGFSESIVQNVEETESLAQDRQLSFDIQDGPVFAVDVFRLAGGDCAVLMSAHHLAIDLVSWRVIWSDLQQIIDSSVEALGPAPTSFLSWSKLQQDRSQGLTTHKVLPFEVQPSHFNFWGLEPESNIVQDQDVLKVSVDSSTTALLLGNSNDAFQSEPLDILTAALFAAFRSTFGQLRTSLPPVFIEGHGREVGDSVGLDLSETVGWFTTVYPLQITDNPKITHSPADLVKIVKDLRSTVPGKGEPYFASRYHNEDGRVKFSKHDQVELLLNYVGAYQQLESRDALFGRFQGAHSMDLKNISPNMRRFSLIEVDAAVENDELNIHIAFNKKMKHVDQLKQWAGLIVDNLKDACNTLAGRSRCFTLADFPLLTISYSGLDAVINEQLAGMDLSASDISDIYPCTPLQEGILLSQKRGAASYATHLIWECESSTIATPVSPQELEKAWRTVVGRHSIFSTLFVEHPETGAVLQVLLSSPEPRITHITPNESDPVLALQNMEQPEFLQNQPQWAVTICQSNSGHVACRLDISHALSDAASMSVIQSDLTSAYKSSRHMPTPPQFREVVEQVQRTSREERMAYWADYLAGSKPTIFPTTVRQASADKTSEIGHLPVVSSIITDQIYKYCREKGITRSELLQIAWALALSQYMGTSQVTFGYLTSGRNVEVANIDNLVGPVINMLVGSIDLTKSLEEIQEKTHQDSLNHFTHQHTSLAEMHHELGLINQRLFNVTITVQNDGSHQKKDATESPTELQLVNRGGADPHEYDLTLSAMQKGEATELVIGHQVQAVSTQTASEVGGLLEAALTFILEAGNDTSGFSSTNLRKDFFSYRTGVSEEDADNFWEKQFEGASVVHFPSLPSPTSVSQPTSKLNRQVENLAWSVSKWSASTLAWAAWSVVSGQLLNSSEVVFGASSTRSTVPVRAIMPGDSTVEQFLEQLERQNLQLTQHANTGLHRIGLVSEAANECCQFQTLLTVRSVDETIVVKDINSSCALILDIALAGNDQASLDVRYDSRLIQTDLLERYLGQFEHVIRQFCNPTLAGVKLTSLEVLSPDNLREIWQRNATLPATIDRCIHDMFADMAQEQPDATALNAWNGELSYGELDRLSSQLAHHLINNGVGPEATVPLVFEKSMWMPVAMLGVMKAGGACVTVDVNQPEQRLKAISQQITPILTISSIESAGKAASMGEKNITIGAELFQDLSQPEAPLPAVDPASVVYLAFTSGSTGEPKGVMITHTNFASALYHQGPALGFNKTSRVYDFASYAFDVAWYNAFQTLIGGGCLCIPSEHQRKNELSSSILQLGANHLTVTPTVVDLLEDSVLKTLRMVETGGEAVRQRHLDRISAYTKARIAYGPVECTAGVTWAWEDLADSNIGTAIGGCVWVVDPVTSDRLVDVGELWIEGPIVGRGYLNDTEKTAASFVEDPEWLLRGGPDGSHGRSGPLYRTGDIVRYRPDGSLVFVGRKDAQVKLRGQRVELAEVEHHIRKVLVDAKATARGVSVVAEIITPEQRSSPMLVAFLSIDGVNPQTNKEVLRDLTKILREKLVERVPVYMVPDAYIAIGDIPHTATGKTDRRQLRRIGNSMSLQELADLDPSRERRAPTTRVEKKLQELWAAVLGMETAAISADDSFLNIGDSIAAMQLVGVARRKDLIFSVADVFKHPKLCDLAQVVKESSEEELPIIEAYALLKPGTQIEEARASAAKACGVELSQIEDLFPCTSLQEGLLSLTVKRPGDYVNHNVLELQNGIDVERLRAVLEEVSASVPVLRTRIISLPGQGLVQAIIKEPLTWSVGATVQEVVEEHKSKPMGLGTPLAQFGIAMDSSPRLVLTLHHAVYDGYSMQLLLDYVEKAYQKQTVTPPQGFQGFVKHVMSLESEDTTQYWQKALENCEAPTYPSLPSADYQPRVDGSITHGISDLKWPRQNNITPSTLVRAAWTLLMASYTNSNDVLMGTTVTGRQAAVPGIESIMGPTIATVPVRTRVDWSQTTDSLLQQIQTQSTEMVEFEQTGLQRIWRIQDCRFQTLLVIQPAIEQAAKNTVFNLESELEGANASNAAAFSTYALSIECQLYAEGAQVHVYYDSHVVDNMDLPSRMAQQFEHILRQLCDPLQRAANLSGLGMASNSDVNDIWKWNAVVPETSEFAVHELFAQVAQQQPGTLAIDAWDGQLTYRELDRLSTLLANHLASLGVVSESVIPLCFEKSMWTTVATLAVMKAGGTSVALDITQPEDRLTSILRQVRPQLTIASNQGSEIMARVMTRLGSSDATAVLVNAETISSLPPSDAEALPKPNPANALYIAFTSGSTGEPKGVIITHENFTSGVKHQQDILGFRGDSRVYDFASYAFDVSWYNAYQTLCAGGCLCVPSEHQRKNELSQSIVEFKANRVTLTSTVLDLLEDSTIETLRLIETGGEAVTKAHVDRITKFGKECRIAYGPVECTIGVTWAWENFKDHDIGRGLGACTWVVDETSGSLAAVGCIGELWIEGPLVGRGYLNDEKKTAASFVEDPKWLVEGTSSHQGRHGRLYKTGDLVKYKPDGSLIFVGRKDAQVKLRGQRVELAEVEHHVLHQLMVQSEGEQSGETIEKAVKTRDDVPQVVADIIKPQGSDAAMLIAFVVPPGAASLTKEVCVAKVAQMTGNINETLATVVPSYMVPSGYVSLQRIPTMTTGKTDRRLLHRTHEQLTIQELNALMESPSEKSKQRRAVSTPEEYQLQGLWAEVLNVEPESISADDSFFRLGGDSIHAMRMVSLAHSQDLLLTVADVFANPRLSNQAKLLKRLDARDETVEPFSLLGTDVNIDEARKDAASLCHVDESQIQDIFPCTPLQEGLLAMTTRRAGDYVAQVERPLQPHVSPEAFKKAWDAVVAVTPVLRSRMVDLPGRGLVQVVIDEPAQWDAQQPIMGLGTRLSHVSVHSNEEGVTSFTWSVHHVLYDGWSMPLVLNAVERAFEGSLEEFRLTSFQPFIKHVIESSVQGAETFWRGQFAALQAPQYPTLPSASFQPRADTIQQRVVKGLGRPPQGFTLSTTIRTAWAALISSATSSNDVVFGAVVSGRQVAVPGVEHMAGPTIATVPVRVSLDRTLSLEDVFGQVQDNAAQMIPYEQTGLQNIQRVSPESQEACRFQTLLVVQPPVNHDNGEDDSSVFAPLKQEAASDMDGLDAFSTYAIALICEPDGDDLRIVLSSDSRVVKAARGERLLQQFEHIIRQMNNPAYAQAPLNDVSMVSETDINNIWGWNKVLPETADVCVHEMFTVTALSQPEAHAVNAWDGSLTYSEVEDLSTRLAHHLIELGVANHKMGPEPIVPLCFEKSMWMPVAMLGVMKAGAAAVSLDVTQPEERIRSIIDQVKPFLTVSSTDGADMMSRLSDREVNFVVNAETLANLPPLPADAVLPKTSPDTALYLAFTSGSTGLPKGVIITQSNFTSGIKHQQETLEFRRDSRVYDFASYAFDVSWYNAFQTLVAGGCMCIPSEHQRKNDLAGSIISLGANQATLTATVTEVLPDSVIKQLRLIETGGEAVNQAQIDRMTALTKVRIAYGPVECTVGVTWATEDLSDRAIGRGLGACTWVVDTESTKPALAAVGSIGELWIEGPLVGRGYLNDPDKTAETFIEDPAWLVEGSGPGFPGRRGRLYKTGDLVRYNENGTLTFIRRKDTQIKIRGQRVELGEVEHHLLQLLGGGKDGNDGEKVQVVAEVVTPSDSEAAMLVVFVLPDGDTTSMTDEELSLAVAQLTNGLNGKLARVVPAYMVPSGYIPLRTMPMMTTGKTDRRRLRNDTSALTTRQLADILSATSSRRSQRPVSTDDEKLLQKIWDGLFGLDQDTIGADDSFFDIGGDSIQAMRLVSATQREGKILTVADVLRWPLLSEMALRLQSSSSADESSVPTPEPFSLLNAEDVDAFIRDEIAPNLKTLNVEDIADVLPITHSQRAFLDGATDGTPIGINNFFLDLPGSVDAQRLEKCCKQLVEHFEILRAVFVASRGTFYQVLMKHLDVPLEHHTVEEEDTDAVSARFDAICEELDHQIPSLGHSFLRFIVAQSEKTNRMRFIIRISHAQYDGIALGRILEALAVFYVGKGLPEEPAVSSLVNIHNKPIDYTYWESLLSNSSMSLMNHESPVHLNGNGAGFKILWAKRTITNWNSSNKANGTENGTESSGGVTPATKFTTACALMLSRLTGSSDLLFGRVVSGRGALPSTIRDMVYPCITALPVRVRLSSSDSAAAADVSKQVQDQFISGLAYENIGLQHLSDNCASWPQGTHEFGLITQYQNVEENPIVEIANTDDDNATDGGLSVPTQHYRSAADEQRSSDTVQIVAIPAGKDIELVMSAKSTVCDRERMEAALDIVSEVMQQI
nr:nonribosomal peptide synthetase gene [Verruciconidia persicina]